MTNPVLEHQLNAAECVCAAHVCRRPEKLKDMTYTQFWNLVRERKVDHVSTCFAWSALCVWFHRPKGCVLWLL